ncbi:hypothetical protein [Streptomyces sp. NBC_00829]|uniref:hypothetical protein n=1 Tax=Streptomyces sp. NBC_00829 TaxID=2903679 RepID=UPI00386573FA|nr:hypothetical protein OG293_23200 [Streptomyces sp. NBC_00829]
MSDSEDFEAIAEIASALRDATDGNEYHAVGLIYDIAKGRRDAATARAEFAELELRHI